MSVDGADPLRCSLILFLATSTEEFEILEAAGNHGIAAVKRDHPELGKYHWLGRVGNEVVIAPSPPREGGMVVMGAHGRLGTAARGLRFRQATGAQGIVQVGMAFGADPAVQALGDVLVSTSLVPYDNRVVRDHPEGGGRYVVDYSQARPEPARPALVDLFLREAHREVARGYRVHVGAVLSGGARVFSASFRDELIRGAPPGGDGIVGGEMEGVGLLAASSGRFDPVWCVVKGISDFADDDRDGVVKEARVLARRNAVDFVFSALKNGRRATRPA